MLKYKNFKLYFFQNQGWNKLEQGSVNEAFGVKNGEWRAYWRLVKKTQKIKRWKYINPADNVTHELV